MYNKFYESISRDHPVNYRKAERDALINAIKQLQAGIEIGPNSVETIKACALMQKLWSIILSDVINDGNKLPIELRASIISIGIWIQKELISITEGKSNNFTGIIEINQIIADGLA